MYEKDKILKIYFNTFLKRVYDIHGIIIEPFTEDFEQIKWRVSNPRDLSFNMSVIIDFVHDLFMDFSELVSESGRALYDFMQSSVTKIWNESDFPSDRLYINKKHYNELKNKAKEITNFDFEDLEGKIDIFDFSLDNRYNEELHINYKVIFSDLQYKGMGIQDFSEEYKSEIISMLESDFSDYQFDLCKPFTRLITSNPLLYDNSYMYIENDFHFYDKNKKPFRLF